MKPKADKTMKAGTRHPTKRRVPHVGDVVLFRIDHDVQVPLMVTRVELVPPSTTRHEARRFAVCGHVFTYPDVHAESAWVRDNRFFKPTPEQPTFLVEHVAPGRALGEWEFADDAPTSK